MRVVVTGASGNVGSQVLPRLLSSPQVSSVVGVCRRPPASFPDVEWHAADVAADDLRPALRGADVVVHLAWLLQPSHDEPLMRRVNLGGTRAVLDAMTAESVPALVHASSVGAYSPATDKAVRVDESFPTGGIASSAYSRHKSRAERMLDGHERTHPDRRVARLRPGVVLQSQAASALARYFLGSLVPQRLVRPSLVPVVPRTAGLALQAVHATDVADAFVAAATRPVHGAFNVASEPVLDPATLAEALHAHQVPVPRTVLRALVDLSWRLRLQPTDPGWLDLGTLGPLMDTTRARTELGWSPTVLATDAVAEVVAAMGARAGADTPVLRPRRGLVGA